MGLKVIAAWVIAFFVLIICPNYSLAGIVWETNFDNLPDWESQETLTGTAPGTIYSDTADGLLVGEATGGVFSNYRSARGVLSSLGESTYQINSDYYRGASGKALGCHYEIGPAQTGGGLGIWLGEAGHDEIYLSFWMMYEDDYRMATAGGLGGLILKYFRLMSNVDEPGAPGSSPSSMSMYYTPAMRPDWLDNCGTPNSQGECGKQGYFIATMQQLMGTLTAALNYNPEGRAGSINDLFVSMAPAAHWKDIHGRRITTGVLPTAFTYPTEDWVGNGEWVHYEFHAKHNTIGQSDGVFELFVDGVKVAGATNLQSRLTEQTKFNYIIIPDNHYNRVYIANVPGPPNGEQTFAIDDIVVSTTYVGPDYIISDAPLVVEDPVVEDPVVEDPVVEDPVVEDPVVEDPVVEDPVVEHVLPPTELRAM